MYQQYAGMAMQMAGDVMGAIAAGDREDAARKLVEKYQAQKLDLTKEGGKAIAGNLENQPEAEKLASRYNKFSQDEVNKALRVAIPEYDRIRKEQLGVIEPMLKGELSKDVLGQMQREASVYGVTSGTGGSQFAGYKGLRQLGLKSLEYAQKGLSSSDQWLQSSYQMTKAPLMDVSSMFVTPQQQATFDQSERGFQLALEQWQFGVPTENEYWAQTLKSRGGQLQGSGASGMDKGWKDMFSSSGSPGSSGGTGMSSMAGSD